MVRGRVLLTPLARAYRPLAGMSGKPMCDGCWLSWPIVLTAVIILRQLFSGSPVFGLTSNRGKLLLRATMVSLCSGGSPPRFVDTHRTRFCRRANSCADRNLGLGCCGVKIYRRRTGTLARHRASDGQEWPSYG